MTFRLRVGNEIRDYATMKSTLEDPDLPAPTWRSGNMHKVLCHWHWVTPCGHSEFDPGYEYGCDHLECAYESARYGSVPYDRDNLLNALSIARPAVAIVLLFLYLPLAIGLIVSHWVALIISQEFRSHEIDNSLAEFKNFGTVGGIPAAEISHHGGAKDTHLTRKISAWEKLRPEFEHLVKTFAVLWMIFLLVAYATVPASSGINWFNPEAIFHLFVPLVVFTVWAIMLQFRIPFPRFMSIFSEKGKIFYAMVKKTGMRHLKDKKTRASALKFTGAPVVFLTACAGALQKITGKKIGVCLAWFLLVAAVLFILFLLFYYVR